MSKQDRQGARTVSELERKYRFDRQFAEILGIATDARKTAYRVESELQSEIKNQVTSITRDTEQIIMSALESYVESSDYEEFRSALKAELAVMADSITMHFASTTERITTVEGETQAKLAEIYKNINFDEDGITIGSSENAIKMNLDNDQLVFSKNGVEIVRLDIDNFTPTNVYIKAGGRFRMGKFAVNVLDNGVPALVKVGE